MDLLTQRRSPNSALSLHTQKRCTARGSSWGFLSLSLTAIGFWIHLWGRIAKPFVSSLTPVPPIDLSKFMKGAQYEFVRRRRPIEYSVAAKYNLVDEKFC